MIKQSEIRPEIAFYIGLKNVKKSIENADLNIGNPGVGGTQYLFLLTVKKYNEKYNGKRAILLSDSELNEIYKWRKLVENSEKCVECNYNKNKKSNDARMLQHDLALKIGYLIESGKAIDLVARKFKGH